MKQYLFLLLFIPVFADCMQEREQTHSKELARRIVNLYPYVESNPKIVRLLAATIAHNPARVSALRRAVAYKEKSYQRRSGGANHSVSPLAQCMLESLTTAQEQARAERLKVLFFGFLAGSCAMLLVAQRLRAFAH